MAISDNSISIRGDYNAASILSDDRFYSDISTELIHPLTGQALQSIDLDAVRQSVKNIILTPLGNRPFNPKFGSRVNELLFDLSSWVTQLEIKNEIERSLNKNEPRIKNIDVSVKYDEIYPDILYVTIQFVVGYASTQILELTLNRTR